ncbi:hypothetical protein [Microbacterium halophytorum]|uniref:hypothetical protein n=1 Tax=Microbacterium halophytorum TaxID=2067568 RepID=UPI000CFC7B30|nr:hypothetical protein [Microbacterium halophytorum]
MGAPRMLTFRQAAKVAGRSVRSLHNWRAAGMVTTLNDKGHRVVHEEELMKHKRIHLRANPVHAQRLRNRVRDTP